MAMSRIEFLTENLALARKATVELLVGIKEDDYYRPAGPGLTHIAWQLGHLAIAEYSLTLRRVRGELPSDEQVIAAKFREMYGKGSVPNSNPAENYTLSEIRQTMDRVHALSLSTVAGLSEAELDKTQSQGHRFFSTNFGSIWWCGMHEMSHGGQIALLRRLFGLQPIW